MSYLIEKMTLSENLYWAWEKIASEFRACGGWYDEIELESFGANIEKELQIISEQFQKLSYKMLPLKPVLYPRKIDDKDGPQSRQWFWVPIRNQVAWTAFTNVVGPFLDYRMPNWSYGNRLYRPIWYELDDNGKHIRKIGWYRNTSNKLYKHFNQSWNVYRRNILYTSCRMTKQGNDQCLSQEDIEELKQEERMPDKLRLPYLRPNYWKKKSEKIYWAGIDFEKFYPSINLDFIRENVKKFMPTNEMSEDLYKLLCSLLAFPVDLSGYSTEEITSIGLSSTEPNINCVPTGLFVAGFLANVSMLNVDNIVDGLVEKHQIAHFKYVDDHIILAQDFETLIGWKKRYEEILKENVSSVKIKLEKIKPDSLKKYFTSNEIDKDKISEIEMNAKKESELDPRFPTPLMTKTLAHISALADIDPDLLDENEQKRLLGDLEHLLLTDFPDNELREDTRISFAASMISRVARKRFPHLSTQNVYFLDREISKSKNALKSLASTKISKLNAKSKHAVKQEIGSLKIKIDELEQRKREADADRIQNENMEKEKIFCLLLKALEEHPEKVKIWNRIFQYCQYVGYEKLQPIFQEYNRLSKDDKLNINYYRALILQILAGQLISCTKTILNNDELFYRRQAAFRYLINIIKELNESNLYKEADQKYYEIHAKHLFECAIGTMWLALNKAPKHENEIVSSEDLKKIGNLCNYYDFIKWDTPNKWLYKKLPTLSEWAWWAENKISIGINYSPGIVWKTTAGLLDIRDPVSWAMWKKYPSAIGESNIAINQLIKAINDPNLKIIQSSESGWVLDMIRSIKNKYDLTRVVDKHGSAAVSLAIKALLYEKKDYINLFEWVDWLKQLYEKDPFNTRLSEWTALKIIKKICLLINSSITGLDLKKTINPSNFLLPKKWQEEMPDSWRDWEEILDSREIILSHTLIEDGRYTPIFLGELADVEYAPVRGMSLLMLGLLTRSFKLPSIWNPQGQRLARNYVLKRMIGSCKCSSWTSAILGGCFSPKVRETILFEPLQSSIFSGLLPAVDTTIDPPRILDLNQFVKYIDRSLSILKKYQISTYQNKPMQLTPINVEQLTQSAFNEEAE